jgi:hypothetical protein
MEPTLTGLAERIDLIVAGTDTFFLLMGAIPGAVYARRLCLLGSWYRSA